MDNKVINWSKEYLAAKLDVPTIGWLVPGFCQNPLPVIMHKKRCFNEYTLR
ncbi:MAG: hypothetical protein HXS48_12780 [Theionarchaea archaeon]|nr:hypothetical protein [Theionarchaea archaeon]